MDGFRKKILIQHTLIKLVKQQGRVKQIGYICYIFFSFAQLKLLKHCVH